MALIAHVTPNDERRIETAARAWQRRSRRRGFDRYAEPNGIERVRKSQPSRDLGEGACSLNVMSEEIV